MPILVYQNLEVPKTWDCTKNWTFIDNSLPGCFLKTVNTNFHLQQFRYKTMTETLKIKKIGTVLWGIYQKWTMWPIFNTSNSSDVQHINFINFLHSFWKLKGMKQISTQRKKINNKNNYLTTLKKYNASIRADIKCPRSRYLMCSKHNYI